MDDRGARCRRHGRRGDIRYRLVNQLLREERDAVRRGSMACADVDGNVEAVVSELHRYGEERDPAPAGRGTAQAVVRQGDGRRPRIRPAQPVDALALQRLYQAATPQPVARLEAIRLLRSWERQGNRQRVPRSSLAILRFADIEAFVQEAPRRQGRHATRQVPPGRRGQGGPAALLEGGHWAGGRCPCTHRLRTGHDRARTTEGEHRPTTASSHRANLYQSPIDRRAWRPPSGSIADVTLLMKETLVRVAEPALVPAGVR